MKFIRMVLSDWMKTKNTAVRWIIYIIPIIYPVAMLLYNNHNSLQVEYYDSFFSVMAMFIPIGVALISSLLCEQEQNAGAFIGLLTKPRSRVSIYMSKLTLVTLLILFDIVVSTTIFVIGATFTYGINNFEYIRFFQGALLMSFGTIVICCFNTLISFKFGLGASIGLGAMGVLITGILGFTSVGDGIWQYLIWTFPARLSQLPGMFLKDANLTIDVGSYAYNQLQQGSIACIIFTILIIMISLTWFNRWEGKKQYE